MRLDLVVGKMKSPWHTLASDTYDRFCEIVIPSHETYSGVGWTNVPALLSIGWNSAAGTVSILDPFSLTSFNPGKDPHDFNLLVEREKDFFEASLLRESERLRSAGREKEAQARRHVAEEFVFNRVIRNIRLDFSTGFTYPDPEKHLVRVRMEVSRTINPSNDVGTLVPRSGAFHVDQVRPSPREKLDENSWAFIARGGRSP